MKKLRKFKLCKKCNKELSYTKFRERKDTGWTDINNKLRYTYCRECEKKRFKEAYKRDPIPQMLSNSKIRAKAKNLAHNITTEDIKKVWPKDNICPVLKKPFVMGFKLGKTKSMAPSLDKIIPNKGYIRGNIFVISDILEPFPPHKTIDIFFFILIIYD